MDPFQQFKSIKLISLLQNALTRSPRTVFPVIQFRCLVTKLMISQFSRNALLDNTNHPEEVLHQQNLLSKKSNHLVSGKRVKMAPLARLFRALVMSKGAKNHQFKDVHSEALSQAGRMKLQKPFLSKNCCQLALGN